MKKQKTKVVSSSDDTHPGLPIGWVEVFSGALAMIVPIPGFRVAGGVLIGDGIRRIADAGERMDQQNRRSDVWPSTKAKDKLN